jgi:crotonobetainyl-CoA:carnitine CoA-transferase CaiB-like acyl-CoA transferase
VAPYGVFTSRDQVPILISVQNDREWVVLCNEVLKQPGLVTDPRFATNPARIANRSDTDALVARCFEAQDIAALSRRLETAQIAFARVNDVLAVLQHPHFRRVAVASPWGPIDLPAPPARVMGTAPTFGPLPALGEHTAKVRREFLGQDGAGSRS